MTAQISVRDALTEVAKKLPASGVSYREFVTRAARLRGDPDDVIEKVIRDWVADGGKETDIVRPGPNLSKE